MTLYSPATGAVTNLNDPVQFAGTAMPLESQGKIGDTYWQWDAGTNRELNIWFKYPPPNGWVKFIGIAIPPDRIAVTIRYGNSPPPPTGGQNGDIYLYLDNTLPRKIEIYTYEQDMWNLGATFLQPSVYYGNAEPSGNGIDGDVYVRFLPTPDFGEAAVEMWAWDTGTGAWVKQQTFALPDVPQTTNATHLASGDPNVNVYYYVPPNTLGSPGDLCFTYAYRATSTTNGMAIWRKKANDTWPTTINDADGDCLASWFSDRSF